MKLPPLSAVAPPMAGAASATSTDAPDSAAAAAAARPPLVPPARLKPSQSRPSQLLGALYRPLQSRLRHDAVRPARRSRSYSLTHFVTDGGSAGDVSGWAPRVRIGIGLVTAEVPPNSQRAPPHPHPGHPRN